MPNTNILRLDDYRGRRELRARLAASLYRADPGRSGILEHLSRMSALVGADRLATVWIDEYGAGIVHPYVVLDLLCDRPRRAFSSEPLQRAWETGVPGIVEIAGGPGSRGEDPGWTMAVALGSDGTRSWFVVADSVSPRGSLNADLRDQLMFVAGECSAVVLHRDLDAMAAVAAEEARRTKPRFAGWPILQDIEGREDDELESRCIARRFVVARLPRLLVEDDLAIPLDRLRQQAQRARAEVSDAADGTDGGGESRLWNAVLDAFEEGDLEGLGASLVQLGESVEQRNQMHGATELYRTAYEIFAALGLAAEAVDAARFAGRAQRKIGLWEEAQRWYGVAREVAQTIARDDKVAVVLMGAASALRERGSLPTARATLDEALTFAERSGDRYAIGSVAHGLLAVEHLRGNLCEALDWGWRAVTTYEADTDRVLALASLAGALTDAGELEAAEDGWACVLRLATDDYYRLYAADALGHIAALRGDRAGFARWSAQADAMAWDAGPAAPKAEILYYRGLSYRALGDLQRARVLLDEAVRFAESRGFSRTLFAAEKALRELEVGPAAPAEPVATPTVAASTDLRVGLREMRLGLAATPRDGGVLVPS